MLGSGGIVPRSHRFNRRERALGTHWIGGQVSPTAGLDLVSKTAISGTRRESNSNHLIVQTVASRYPGSRIEYGMKQLENNSSC
jgi:hypothetical protein